MPSAPSRAEPRLTPKQALLYGGLFVGFVDIVEIMVFVGLKGISPTRVLQHIASGLLGRSSYGGGLPTAALGLALHFLIAFAVVAVYLAASRRLPRLVEAPIVWGLVYGLAVYLVMNRVVVPASATAPGARTLPAVLNGLTVHVLGVGLPAALFARAASRPRVEPAGAGLAAG